MVHRVCNKANEASLKNAGNSREEVPTQTLQCRGCVQTLSKNLRDNGHLYGGRYDPCAPERNSIPKRFMLICWFSFETQLAVTIWKGGESHSETTQVSPKENWASTHLKPLFFNRFDLHWTQTSCWKSCKPSELNPVLKPMKMSPHNGLSLLCWLLMLYLWVGLDSQTIH